MSAEFEIDDETSFAPDEREAAKDYWASRAFKYYTGQKVWSVHMANRIVALKPRSVFEFGCNAGKNLTAIKTIAPDVQLTGVDINAAAIEYGRERGLDISVGDEAALTRTPENAFDVSFTVSVLDHMPDPDIALRELARISRAGVLLLEPWLEVEGKVTKNSDRKSGELIDTTPYSYSWNYEERAARLLPEWSLEVEDYPLDSNIGRYYRLFTLRPPLTAQES